VTLRDASNKRRSVAGSGGGGRGDSGARWEAGPFSTGGDAADPTERHQETSVLLEEQAADAGRRFPFLDSRGHVSQQRGAEEMNASDQTVDKLNVRTDNSRLR